MAGPPGSKREVSRRPEAGQHAGEMVPAPWVKKVIIAGSEICSFEKPIIFCGLVFSIIISFILFGLHHSVLFLGFQWGREGCG